MAASRWMGAGVTSGGLPDNGFGVSGPKGSAHTLNTNPAENRAVFKLLDFGGKSHLRVAHIWGASSAVFSPRIHGFGPPLGEGKKGLTIK
jgi:hypothetical protein